jgi:hypothetical protein
MMKQGGHLHRTLLAAFGMLTFAGRSRAAETPAPRVTYLLAGVPLAVSTHPGFTVGAEASLACWGCVDLTDLSWLGVYVDGVRDFGTDSFRFSAGPELGFGILGVDGGVMISTDADDTRAGWTVRGLLTFGIIAAYGRYIDVRDEPVSGEFGLLLKAYWRL